MENSQEEEEEEDDNDNDNDNDISVKVDSCLSTNRSIYLQSATKKMDQTWKIGLSGLLNLRKLERSNTQG
ncbi:hypothetical protein O6P43_013482 [Quillaja saponaria]|uniref:Uncharacterized protein n=1 Tax=Quillaja saponaria TaxID=32244 RepID=A0AAD7LU90_QUISA|nr:hypothetical protein O6P43_013482 [Quillaja saponaria]